MIKKTIAQVSEDTLKIQAFIDSQRPGAILTYTEIQSATGVRMNTDGKAKLRRACKRARREYSPVRGSGIRLASAETALSLVSNRLVSINNATKRGDKTTKLMHEQFFESLSTAEQRQILFAGAVFGAIRVAAENGKLLYKKNKEVANDVVQIPIPKISG